MSDRVREEACEDEFSGQREGEFVRNIPTGRGKFTWPDGSTYSGGIVDGVRHGFGTHTCAKTGVSYTGEWSQGKRHGEGTVYYNESKTSWYKGDWVMNNREGRGERCYVTGNTYSGEWKCNVRHGEGTMKWLKLGQQYVGNWCEGLQVRQISHQLSSAVVRTFDVDINNGHVFKGEFKDDKMMTPDLSGIRSPSLSGKTI
uniref:Uncharacterized protein n=1 Tax=Oryzias sinensis TaxID=183150 RepID=A0A8C7ZB80_9TELE